MKKDKRSRKKYGKRLAPEVQGRLKLDIEAGMSTGELVKKYKITDMTILRYKKKVEMEKKVRPPSVMDLKKALDLSKAQSLLVFTMEQMETAMKRADEDRDKYNPVTQANIATQCGRLILEIHNTLLMAETPEIPGGYGENDIQLNEMLMDMLTDKQKEEIFEKFTGQSLKSLATKQPPTGDKPNKK